MHKKYPYLKQVNLINFSILIVIFINLRMNLITNFARAGWASEHISQVHTTKEFHDTLLKIKSHIISPVGPKPNIVITDDPLWPSSWYLKNLPEYHPRVPKGKTKDQFYYILERPKKNHSKKPYSQHHTQLIRLRGWWVPDWKNISLKKFFMYTIFHTPWNKTGYTKTAFSTKIDHWKVLKHQAR